MSISLIRGIETVPAIDAAKIKGLFKSIREASGSLDLAFDLNVHENVEALFITSLSASDEIRSGLVRLRALLMANNLKATLQARLEKAEARDTLDKRENAVTLVWQYIGREVNELRGSMEQVADSLTQAALNMEQINLSARPEKLLARLKMDTQQRRVELVKTTERHGQLLEDRQLLDDTIAALDKLDWKDLSELLPTAEEVEMLKADPTKTASIQVGLDRVKKLIGNVAGAITFRDAIRLRDELRAEQERAREGLRLSNATLLEYTHREEALGTVLALHDQKQSLQQELLRVAPVLGHYDLTLMMKHEARDFAGLLKQVDECATFVDGAYMQVR